MAPYISALPLRESERPRVRSIQESCDAVRAHANRKRGKQWQPPQAKDPNEFYFRHGSQQEARASQLEAARRQGEPNG